MSLRWEQMRKGQGLLWLGQGEFIRALTQHSWLQDAVRV